MTPLIIDTDPGVDDAFALALACAAPEVDLIGVTTVFGNVGLALTTRNALRVLALYGRDDVPVAAGAEQPLVHPHPHRARHVHGADGLSGQAETLPERATGVAGVDAVSLLVSLLESAPAPVTIVPIGPLTNIALLLAAHPGVRSKIARLVVMGGALGGGNVTAAAEFNIWSDPEAARRVLVEEPVPVTLVPMDLTTRCAVDGPWLDSLAAAGPRGATLVSLTATYREHYSRSLGRDGMVVHDAVAVAEAIKPGLLHTTAMPVEVDCGYGPGRGNVIADQRATRNPGEGREVDVALSADLDQVRSFLLSHLAG
ncbi:nucleoside hydrolase [Actinophytocola algeriensis]|uniref:Pyrimidine-specific ribonucleoside hydrolase n=1 Tax=Actinophytocola algeriensis TaxID=1768010 RepID=A0A7W7VFG2_9PSEU|nr:nucleoside hydrolase [Actinophytocola algeriensis]MBB4908114.1 pyrimidine-specific ribonucleoside hydrolase [Actinophytocola algeriensis]MBE1480144.1 pyrimidine-specific ribonucleoside hydrolase [Actinophytocola algeriensis]